MFDALNLDGDEIVESSDDDSSDEENDEEDEGSIDEDVTDYELGESWLNYCDTSSDDEDDITLHCSVDAQPTRRSNRSSTGLLGQF